MKVNSLDNNISFNGFYNSKGLKNILTFAQNNGVLFMSTTALGMSALIRPLSILAAPKTDKENRKIACAKSIVSTILDFVITFAISAPIVAGMSAITKNPEKFMNSETIKNLKTNSQKLEESKAFEFANQLFRLGVGLIIAAPKAILNLAGMPYIMKAMGSEPKNSDGNLTFKGKNNESIAKIIGKIIDKKSVQDFSKKNADTNFPMHITALKDTLTTGTFVLGAYNTKKIQDNRKGPLIYNSIISTVLSIAAAYAVDGLTKPIGNKFLKKLEEANKSDVNLVKYKQGFKIAKPTIIMAIIYYALIPLCSTFIAERLDKKIPVKK